MSRISRREFLGYSRWALAPAAVGGLVLEGRPGRAVAQTLTKVRFTLPWVAEGSLIHAFIARNRGFWKKRGLDVDIARGYGSLAATQALAGGQFDVGQAVTSVIVLQHIKGLPLQTIGVLGYKTTMGVGVLADSPIKTPKDLENKTVGWTPTSGEVPFFPVFAKLAGIDQDKIKFVNMNIDVRYRAFMDKQIDAITDFAASALPPLAARGYKVRWMLYASYGIHLYESALFTTSKTIKENPELCQGMVDGMMEALAFSYLNPEESIEIYFKEVREAGFVAKERENVRMGFGIANFSGLADEARLNGLGWSDAKRFGEMADLVLTYLAKGAQKPAVEELFTNRFAGRIKLTEAQWADAKKRNEEFAKFFA
jgi:ABC-type nitrate/sulfonate/bicarbonate transport system substrate-binding protein